MYVDETITLRDDLPNALQRDFKELQSYYENECRNISCLYPYA